jgi:hypothetical protein
LLQHERQQRFCDMRRRSTRLFAFQQLQRWLQSYKACRRADSRNRSLLFCPGILEREDKLQRASCRATALREWAAKCCGSSYCLEDCTSECTQAHAIFNPKMVGYRGASRSFSLLARRWCDSLEPPAR